MCPLHKVRSFEKSKHLGNIGPSRPHVPKELEEQRSKITAALFAVLIRSVGFGIILHDTEDSN